MLRSIIAASLAAGLALSSTAHAAAPESAVGMGDSTCGEMLQMIKEAPAAEYLLLGWVQGFMANMNLENFAKGEPIVNMHPAALSLKTQKDTIKTWCAVNPDEKIAKAAILFYAVSKIQQAAAGASSPAKKR